MKTPIETSLPVSTEVGVFQAHYTELGLSELTFPPTTSAKSRAPKEKFSSPKIRQWHRLTSKAVLRVLAGKSISQFPPLDLSAGTDFQKSVWNAMRKIRTGKTQSYGEIAAAIGKPSATRAVGGACGANPIPLLIPCHRVLAAHGKIGGFSGGLSWKKLLLQREGITI